MTRTPQTELIAERQIRIEERLKRTLQAVFLVMGLQFLALALVGIVISHEGYTSTDYVLALGGLGVALMGSAGYLVGLAKTTPGGTLDRFCRRVLPPGLYRSTEELNYEVFE